MWCLGNSARSLVYRVQTINRKWCIGYWIAAIPVTLSDSWTACKEKCWRFLVSGDIFCWTVDNMFSLLLPKSISGQNVAGFRFLAKFGKCHIQILQCSTSIEKLCGQCRHIFVCLPCWDLAIISQLTVLKVSDYRCFVTLLVLKVKISSFMNKSQVRPRLWLRQDLCCQIRLWSDF